MQKNYSIYILACFVFMVTGLSAQSYKTAVGVRFGGLTSGLAIKQFTGKTLALEGIASIGNKSLIVTGLYELHTPVDHSNEFKLYYGVGAHVGFFSDDGSYYYHDTRLYTKTTVAGIDAILGMEYKFSNAPLNIGLDFKPFIDFFNGTLVYFDGGLNIRYTF